MQGTDASNWKPEESQANRLFCIWNSNESQRKGKGFDMFIALIRFGIDKSVFKIKSFHTNCR